MEKTFYNSGSQWGWGCEFDPWGHLAMSGDMFGGYTHRTRYDD